MSQIRIGDIYFQLASSSASPNPSLLVSPTTCVNQGLKAHHSAYDLLQDLFFPMSTIMEEFLKRSPLPLSSAASETSTPPPCVSVYVAFFFTSTCVFNFISFLNSFAISRSSFLGNLSNNIHDVVAVMLVLLLVLFLLQAGFAYRCVVFSSENVA